MRTIRTIRGAFVSLIALALVAVVSIFGTLPADATPAPSLPAPMVFSGQHIGNSSASDYSIGLYPQGGYTPFVSLKIDGDYRIGSDPFSASYFRVNLNGSSWRQKWSPDTEYGACHKMSDTGRLQKPPATPAKVTYKVYSGSSC